MRKYDSYKDSGIEWIGEIPSHWDCKRLKQLVESPLKYGANEAAESDDPSQPRYIRITDFGQNGVLREDTFKSLPENLAKEYLLEEGDILLARSGATVGKTFLFQNYKGKACFAGYLIRCRFSKNLVDSRFINYYTFSNFYENWKQSIFQQATIQNIGADKYNQLLISTPPHSEQTLIANFLDQKTTQIDDLIAKKERLIQLLEEERIAIINHAVTKGLDPTVPMKDSGIEWLGEIPTHWEVKKLKQIFNSSKGLTITKENLESEGIPCVNYGEIHSKFGFEVDIDKHQLKCVAPSYLESDYKSLIQTGDFVFADTSEDVSGAGNFTYLKSNHEIFAGYHTIILRAFCDIEPRYFAYQFDSIPYRTQIRQSVKGIKVFSITQGILKNTSLWIPTLDEQKQIIKFLDIETDRIVSIKNSTRKEIELLKEYKTALISEVVTGKVDVRNS